MTFALEDLSEEPQPALTAAGATLVSQAQSSELAGLGTSLAAIAPPDPPAPTATSTPLPAPSPSPTATEPPTPTEAPAAVEPTAPAEPEPIDTPEPPVEPEPTEPPPTPALPTATPVPPTPSPLPPTPTPEPPTPTPTLAIPQDIPLLGEPEPTPTALPPAPTPTPAPETTPEQQGPNPGNGTEGLLAGEVTRYADSLAGETMACGGEYQPENPYIVAVSLQYDEAWPCGTRLEVCGPGGCLVGMRTDTCPGCLGTHIDMSRAGVRHVCGNESGCDVVIRQAD